MLVADTIVGDLVARLRADTSGFKAGFDDAEKHSQTFAQRMDAVGSKMQSVGAKMSIGLTAPLALLGKASFDAASDLNESMSKAKVVFDDMAPAVVKWSKTAATSMGISQQAALEAAGTFGTLAQSMGMMQGPATDMSMSLVQLASDLASFNNASPEDVLLALRSGLVGEAEPLRKFGVSLSAARVEAEALASGLVKPVAKMTDVAEASIAVEKAAQDANEAVKKYGRESTQAAEAGVKLAKAEEKLSEATRGNVQELTAAQKMQAAYNIIMKDTALAQGDFARTADGAANKQRIMAAQFKDMQAQLGQALIPIFQKVAGVLQDVANWFSNLSPKTQEIIVYVGLLVAAIGPLVGAIGTLISVLTLLAAHPVILTIIAITAAIAALGVAIYFMWTRWDQIWTWIKEHPAYAYLIAVFAPILAGLFALVTAARWLEQNWSEVWATIQTVAEIAKNAILGPFEMIADAIRTIIRLAVRAADAIGNIPSKVTGVVPDVTPWSGLSPFADGGRVPGPVGAPMPILAHGGELVLNPQQQAAVFTGGGGITVNVNAGQVISERSFIDMVIEGVSRAQRQGAPVPWVKA